MQPTIKQNMKPTIHRDETVSWWSVHEQTWRRGGSMPRRDYEAHAVADRARIAQACVEWTATTLIFARLG